MRYTVDFEGREWIDGEYVSPYTRDDEFALGGLDWIHKRDSSCAWETGLPLLHEELGELELYLVAEDTVTVETDSRAYKNARLRAAGVWMDGYYRRSRQAHGRHARGPAQRGLDIHGTFRECTWDEDGHLPAPGSYECWKKHRAYQAHGRSSIPRKVDVIDVLNGMYA